jgi:predicted 3-demethylubiquinone-9 3-methyltransferase (glyoxalase superfamily)
MNQKITPNLWFDGNALEAAEYYVSVFPDSKINNIMRYPNSIEEGLADFQLPLAGKPLVVEYELCGQKYVAINAGPEFKFTEAVSFSISCNDQAEIDYYWDKLSHYKENEQCGWCKDKYGLSWQVVPSNMGELLSKPGAYAKLMQMKKLVIADF